MRICRIAILVAACLFFACGPKPAPAPVVLPVPSTPEPAPSNLTATPGPGTVDLRWTTNLPENLVIKGYNLYRARETGGYELITPLPYPGDLEARSDVETYHDPGLENGVQYHFRVSTIYPGDIEVFGADTASAIPRPEGAFKLTSAFKGQTAGFSFARLATVPTDDLSNDIYLAVIQGKLHLASPSRIDEVLRKTEIFRLPQERTFAYQPPREPNSPGSELVAISVGDEIVVKTSAQCYAYLKILSIDAAGETAEISYLYQPRPRTFRF